MSRIALAIALGFALVSDEGLAAAGPLQTFYVVNLSTRGEISHIMAVSPARVTNAAGGHKVFPVYLISEDETVDTTVLEVDCAAKRRRVISESVLFGGGPDAINKTGQNDLSWRPYGSDAPASEFVCAGSAPPATAVKLQSVDLKTFSAEIAARLSRMRASAK